MRVAWHLGLGDAIICSPIIIKLLEKEDNIIVPCWEHNYISVSSIFMHHPNVKVEIVESDRYFKKYDFKLGIYSKDARRESEVFIDWFYRQAGMSNVDRIEYCPIKKASESTEQRVNPYTVHDYIFLHQAFDRGYKINLSKLNKNNLPIKMWAEHHDKGILSHADIIINAKEIHCIDSSFLHLVEALPTKGKLFYHKYARPNSENYKFLKAWDTIE